MVLLVDDNAEFAQLLTSILELHHLEAKWAPRAADAVAFCRERHEDVKVALLDICLAEGRDGFELGEELRGLIPKLHIIFTSGYSPEILTRNDLVLGKTFLQKPFSTQEFIQAIRTSLQECENLEHRA
jgi:two-component system cell cycle sensor histidine kinase/response regulator CckA